MGESGQLLKQLLIKFCESNFNFSTNIQILGSIHILADNKEVLTCLLNEKSKYNAAQVPTKKPSFEERALANITKTQPFNVNINTAPDTGSLNLLNYIKQLQQYNQSMFKSGQSPSIPSSSSSSKPKRKRSPSSRRPASSSETTDDDSAIASTNPSTNTSSGEDETDKIMCKSDDNQTTAVNNNNNNYLENNNPKKKKQAVSSNDTMSDWPSAPSATEFICTICPKSFKYHCYFKRHMEACHSEAPKYICDHCSKGYKWEASFRQHLRNTHGITTDDLSVQQQNGTVLPAQISLNLDSVISDVISAAATKQQEEEEEEEEEDSDSLSDEISANVNTYSCEDEEDYVNQHDDETLNEDDIDDIQEQINQSQN
jgi:hypothetical protein